MSNKQQLLKDFVSQQIQNSKQQTQPIVNSDGFKNGEPPAGSNWRIPGDTLYNPTPYPIQAVSNNGITKTLNPFDESTVEFPGAKYVDEFEMKAGGLTKSLPGGPTNPHGGDYTFMQTIYDKYAKDNPQLKIGNIVPTRDRFNEEKAEGHMMSTGTISLYGLEDLPPAVATQVVAEVDAENKKRNPKYDPRQYGRRDVWTDERLVKSYNKVFDNVYINAEGQIAMPFKTKQPVFEELFKPPKLEPVPVPAPVEPSPFDGMERLYMDLSDADYAKLPDHLRTEGQGTNGLRNRVAYGWKDKDGTVYYERGVPGNPGYQGKFSGKPLTLKYHFVDELYPKTENPDLVTHKNGGFTKYQDAGLVATSPYERIPKSWKEKYDWTPNVEEEYIRFKNDPNAPDNLRFTDDLNDYNVRGMWDSLERPVSWEQALTLYKDLNGEEWVPEEDGYYHAWSQHPGTGEWLKPKHHSTAWMNFAGYPMDPYSRVVVNPEGFFGDETLQTEYKKNGGLAKAQTGLEVTAKPNLPNLNKPLSKYAYTTVKPKQESPDSFLENVIEFADPTGFSSWDDAKLAYNEWIKSGNQYPTVDQAVSMFGAVPALGKFGKIKYLDPESIKKAYKYIPWQQIVNFFDTAEDVENDNMPNVKTLPIRNNGGLTKYQKGRQVVYTDPEEFKIANQAYRDSSDAYNLTQNAINFIKNADIKNRADHYRVRDTPPVDVPLSYKSVYPTKWEVVKPKSAFSSALRFMIAGYKKPETKPVLQEAPVYIEPKPLAKLPVSEPTLVPYDLPEIKENQTTPIMQASYAHRNGQYQTGENVWNEDKKKWERRMFKDEEADWHRNNGRIKRDGGLTKFVNGGPKDKGWREYKTATGQSFYLDPRFKDQRYYVDEKGNTFQPNQNSMIYDVASNSWESPTLESTLEIRPRYRYEKRPGALGSFETVRIDDDNNTSEIISPNPMETRREQEAFVNSFNPAALAFQGVSNMAQGNIAEGALQTALSMPVVGQVLGKAVTAPLKFAGKEIAQTYGPALSEVGRLATTKTPLKNTWKLNPYRNRLDQYNRVVGRDAIDDALESRVIRSGSGEGLSQRPTAYPSFTNGLPNQTYIDQVINMGETPYIISTNRPMGVSTLGRHGKGTTHFPIGEDYVHGSRQYLSSFPIEETQLYNAQPHWLKGYQKVWNNPTTDLDFSKLHVYNETLPDGRIVRMLGNTSGKPIGQDISSGGAFNDGVYTLTNFPDYVIKAENAALMETMIPGYKGFNISEMQSGLNSPNISKVIKSHPSNDISYQLMRRLSGTPTPDVDPKTLMNISDDAYRQLWRDAKHVRDNNLAIDFAGDNIMYDNATGTFKLLDISPTIEGSEWNSITGGGLEPGMSKGLSAQFLQDALAEKLRLSYARSLKSNGSSPGIRSVLNDEFEKQTVPRIKKIFTDEGPYKEGGSVLKSFVMSQLQAKPESSDNFDFENSLSKFVSGGQHGGLDRWFAEKWVDVKSGKPCGRQEGEKRGYPACRPSKRVSEDTPKTSSEMSPSEKAKFKRTKTSSKRIPYNHKRN